MLPKSTDKALRVIVEGKTNAKLPPMELPYPGRYPSYEEAFRLVGLVGIQNVYAAYFLGLVDRIKTPKAPKPSKPAKGATDGKGDKEQEGARGARAGGRAVTALPTAVEAFLAADPEAWSGLPPHVTLADLAELVPFDGTDRRRGDAGDPAGHREWVAAETHVYSGGLRLWLDADTREVVALEGIHPLDSVGEFRAAPDLGAPDATFAAVLGSLWLPDAELVYAAAGWPCAATPPTACCSASSGSRRPTCRTTGPGSGRSRSPPALSPSGGPDEPARRSRPPRIVRPEACTPSRPTTPPPSARPSGTPTRSPRRRPPATCAWSFAQLPVHPAPRPADPQLDVRLDERGDPLAPALRDSLGAGLDLAGTRVHTGPEAAQTARRADADAVTVGRDVAFAAGRFQPGTTDGRRLIAHELAHAAQQRPGRPAAVHRQKATGTTTAAPGKADQEMFVDGAIRYLEAAAEHYRAIAQAAKVQALSRPTQAPATKPETKEPTAKGTPDKEAPARDKPPTAPPPVGLSEDKLVEALEKLKQTYEGSAGCATSSPTPTAARKLSQAYVNAASGARAAAAGQARVNLVVIAAPKDGKDWFITNATTYARLYFSKGLGGEVVSTIKDVGTIEELLDQIEKTEPNRMIGRIDMFCHGTIEPTHQLKLGKTWHRIDAFESAAGARATTSRTLATRSRFDGSSVIELHACRLGAPQGDPGKSGLAPTTGTDFLSGFGKAVGGEQGQSVVGYEQRWVPRVFSFPGITSPSQLKGKQRKTFDDLAVKTYDAAMAGSTEVQTLLTDAERQGGTVTRDRKVAIMEKLYTDGKGWVIGHQYSTADPKSTDPVKDVKGARDTFTNEKDWQRLVLTVKVPGPAPSGRGTP